MNKNLLRIFSATILLVFLNIIGISSIYAPKAAAADPKPNYVVRWKNDQKGQFPLTISSSWFKSYETKSTNGKKSSSSIPITESMASTGDQSSEDLLFVVIKANSFKSNKDCEIQLKVTRPIGNQSVVTVAGYKPTQSSMAICSEALIAAMDAAVEPDGDNTATGPARDQDPNTDTAEETAADVQAVAEATATTDESCENQGGVTSWFVCPAIDLIGGALNTIDRQINRLLEIDRDKYATNDAMYETWTQFRNIALTILILAMLVMVVSTALGIGALDAYTVKKAFPRMVVAVIFIILSWYVVVFLIDLSNIVGRGVLGLMTSPFGGGAANLSSLFGTSVQSGSVVGGGLVVGGLALGAGAIAIQGALGVLLSWLASGLLVLALAFLVLIARQMFVIVLMLFAPVAILSWIFPGNDKLWKLWWQSFSKLLLMYPMIMALIASGRIFAGVINDTAAAGAEGSLLNPILKLTAYILPYAFIPFTFKAAGGAFGNLAGMVNDRSRGVFDRLKKGRQNSAQQMGSNLKTGKFLRSNNSDANSRINRLNRGLSMATNVGQAGLRPSRWRSNIQAATSTADFAHAMEAAEKDQAWNAISGNDDLMLAGMNGRGTMEDVRSYLAARGYQGRTLDQYVAQVMQAKRSMGNHAFGVAAAATLPGTGTAFAGGAGEMLANIARASEGDSGLATRILAKARKNAEGARRFDLSGAGFGATAGQLTAMVETGVTQQRINDATEHLTDEALFTNGAGAMIGGRGQSVNNLVPAMQRRINRAQQAVSAAHSSGDQAQILAAEREYKQVMASTASLLDVASSVSPENAKILADNLFATATTRPSTETVLDKASGKKVTRRINVTETVGQTIEAFREDVEFGQMRREYGAQQRAQYDRQQAALTQIPGQPPGIPGIPGSGPIPGIGNQF